MMLSSRSLGIVMIVSTHSRSASRPRSAWSSRLRPSNLNGLVTTATVSAPSSLARLAMTGAAPVPVPPPSPVVDEDHVGAVERLEDLLGVLERRRSADVRVGAGAQSFRELGSDLQLDVRSVVLERLHVGVRDDELDALEAGARHAVHGVAAPAADADDLDACAGFTLLFEPQPEGLAFSQIVVVRVLEVGH